MADIEPSEAVVANDEDYASSEDSDFAPEEVPDHASSAGSDDEGDDATAAAVDGDGDGDGTALSATPAKRKPDPDTLGEAEAEDAGFENSGDEAIIGKGKKRRKRDQGGAEGSAGEEDDGGVGGFVKTRSQRAHEKAERRAAAVQGPVTVDVDALWAEMLGNGPPPDKQNELASLATAAFAAAAGGDETGEAGGATNGTVDTAAAATTDTNEKQGHSTTHAEGSSDMIKIKRTYNFAGKVHTEEKLVPRDSAEAKLYLADIGDNGRDGGGGGGDDDEDDDSGPPKRLPRKAFRSAFEPVFADPAALLQAGGAGRRADLDLGLQARLQARARAAAARKEQAKKLNTVEKSRMDWAGFVDREGIQDELVLAGKSKGAFVDRQQFLGTRRKRSSIVRPASHVAYRYNGEHFNGFTGFLKRMNLNLDAYHSAAETCAPA
ncbi:Craniofacial development protein 1/Bucentaur [Niveomyces insectorum RCEF 264]|uniref:SWR1-complex protein 5 n=1 Tax=Niveomyces insectorum RCEF 264 TaxID=1081102 RepID=A0A167N302_9HYPO|nr:Craniofacial development protein 1/Bucentaur [Niveomyces insectorum RCEF 264]